MNALPTFAVICLSTFFSGMAEAQESPALKRIAVLDVEGELSKALKDQIADETRAGALVGLPTDTYTILTRENMISLLRDMGKDPSCIEGQCEVDIGRSIGADYIISGQILQIEGVYMYSMKLHETRDGALVGATRIEASSALELVRKTSDSTATLLKDTLVISVPITELDPEPPSASLKLIQFNSYPAGASVVVDGTMVCPTTPCSAAVEGGFHTVEFYKEQFDVWSVQFQAKAGMEIRADLQARFTRINLESQTEGLNVYIDGEMVGVTPLRDHRISPGPHLLEIKGECSNPYTERFVAKTGIDIFKQVQVDVNQSLADISAVDLQGKRLKGRIYIDGEFLGYTPLQEFISSCANRLEIDVEHNGTVHRRSFPLSLKKDRTEYIQLEFPVNRSKPKRYRKKKRPRRPW